MTRLRAVRKEVTDESLRFAVLAGLATVPPTVVLSWGAVADASTVAGVSLSGTPLLAAALVVGAVYARHKGETTARRAGLWTGVAGSLATVVLVLTNTASTIGTASTTVAVLATVATPFRSQYRPHRARDDGRSDRRRLGDDAGESGVSGARVGPRRAECVRIAVVAARRRLPRAGTAGVRRPHARVRWGGVAGLRAVDDRGHVTPATGVCRPVRRCDCAAARLGVAALPRHLRRRTAGCGRARVRWRPCPDDTGSVGPAVFVFLAALWVTTAVYLANRYRHRSAAPPGLRPAA
jgi:hypothetical protein